MSSDAVTRQTAFPCWQPPLVPETYDRRPLTRAERAGLATLAAPPPPPPRSELYRDAVTCLERLERPLADLVRHCGHDPGEESARSFVRVMRREMHWSGVPFWAWSPARWLEALGPSPGAFHARHGAGGHGRLYLAVAAYLFGRVSDLHRATGVLSPVAAAIFGMEALTVAVDRLSAELDGLGYAIHRYERTQLQAVVSSLFLAQRTPSLEAVTASCLAELATRGPRWPASLAHVATALTRLGILPPAGAPPAPTRPPPPAAWEGVAAPWQAWTTAWYTQEAELSEAARCSVVYRLQAIGRWLGDQAPTVQTPADWTEELALRFRHDVTTWTVGQYAGSQRRAALAKAGRLGQPLSSQSVKLLLGALKRFLLDLQRRPHVVAAAPATRLVLPFSPREALSLPRPIRQRLAAREPRDIDQLAWAKLAIAAATLAEQDLPARHPYPLSLYRALGLLWVTAARRPNELLRLRRDCLRRDWDPTMRDAADQPLLGPPPVRGGEDPAAGAEGLPLCYLHVPAGKNRGPFWIWIPAYTADAIDAWRAERPGGQRPLLDAKDREEVEYLFTVRERRVGVSFFNASLIPTLCRKAGIDQHDAKGRLTGHRGRSTRLTLLLRQGVSLEDLAAYAGHVNTDTIRRYANPHPLQLHRTIKAADDLSRIIEGVVDLEAAARGLPALRWFIGYDADGAPMYCANQAYQTCPHRLDCVKCGMFIGGTKARLLHAGEHTLPVQSTTPLTPLERCVLRDDQAGMDAERAKLAAVPPPDPSSLTVVFNPSGLTDAQLARVAAEGTPEALATLREVQTACEQALADSGRDRTNRNARVGALRKRLASVTDLLAACMEQIAAKRPGVAEGSE